MGQNAATGPFAGRSIVTQRGGAVTAAIPGRVHANDLLQAILHLDRPVLVRHLGTTIVAACPDEVAVGPAIWDALRRTPAPHGGQTPQGDRPLLKTRASLEQQAHSRMAGGWIGLLGDRLAGTVELLPGSPPDDAGPPTGVIARYPAVFEVSDNGRATLHGEADGPAFRALFEACGAGGRVRPLPETRVCLEQQATPVMRSSLPGDLYLGAVERARELIRAGDVYQVNVVQRLDAEWAHGAFALATALWDAAGNCPHRAFVQMDEGTVVSASPERMVACDGRLAWSEPIKGTSPPGGYPALRESVKDRAEHVMIVDLVRNDLGRVARAGGVSVPVLMAPLHTAYADHMVSRVQAELRDDVGPADLLRAVFPAGSVTGAPKVRALEVIREIEPVGRGPAFGSVVSVATDGSVDASVTIRTAWLPTGVPHAQYWCGGAVVWDSGPVAERDEAWRKARPFLTALGAEAP